MLNKKLLEVLSCLQPSDWKKLRLFLQSPYFNNGASAALLVGLFDYIQKYHQSPTPYLEKGVVFRHFFPDKTFREGEKNVLDSLCSEMFVLVRKFIAQQKLERTESATQFEALSLLEFYREQSLEDRFWQLLQSLRKAQENFPFRDAQFYMTQFLIEEETFKFLSLYNSFEDDANLNHAHESLDSFYSILKMEYQCLSEHQKKISQNSKIKIEFPVKLPLGNASSIVFTCYNLVYELLENPGDILKLQKLDYLLRENKAHIPFDKLYDLKAYYRGVYVKNYIQFGDKDSRENLFSVYKEHFEEGFFYTNQKIVVGSFRTLINIALKLNHLDWAKKVLDSHPPEKICGTIYPLEAYNLTYGEYYFYNKQFNEAENLVNYKPFENPHFSLLADVLLLKIFYETQNDLLDYRLKALDQKVRRTRLSPELKTRYYNFIKKLDKIIKYGFERNQKKLDKIREEVQTIPDIIEREWLLEKINDCLSR
jgi:hypothetical protein